MLAMMAVIVGYTFIMCF